MLTYVCKFNLYWIFIYFLKKKLGWMGISFLGFKNKTNEYFRNLVEPCQIIVLYKIVILLMKSKQYTVFEDRSAINISGQVLSIKIYSKSTVFC